MTVGLIRVDLYTTDGQFVERVPFLPYKFPPEVIVWGSRFFLRRSDDKYYECFAHFVVPDHSTDEDNNGKHK